MARKNGPNGKKNQKPMVEKEAFSPKAWREKNPLLSTHVPRQVYEEVKRRAAGERRSVSQYLALFLETAFQPEKV